MGAICGIDCNVCPSYKKECLGCAETNGCPFGGQCAAANIVKEFGLAELKKKKQEYIQELNNLQIVGLPKVEQLYELNGFYVNLEYPLQNGTKVKFLNDNEIYFGCQLECVGQEKCFGIIMNEEFILVCKYGENGTNPELIMYKKR